MEDQAKKEMDQKYTNLMKKAQRGRDTETERESYTESSFRGLEIGCIEIKKEAEKEID